MASRYNRVPVWLKELTFVTDFFSWLFALFSRLAEPFMLLSVLYVIAEAGVPSIASPGLHNLSVAIMICSPEIILPGAFVVARQSQQYSRLLYIVCWCFVALTLVTLVSLFVWHMSGDERAWLMSARCATAFAYSILMRVMFQGSQASSEQQSVTRPVVEAAQFLTRDDIAAMIREALATVYISEQQQEPPLLLISPHQQQPATDALRAMLEQLAGVLPDVATEDMRKVLEAAEQGIARRDICSALKWGSAKYTGIVKPVLDLVEQQQQAGPAATERN